MNSKKISSWILPISILVGLILGVIGLGRYGAMRDKGIIKTGIETVATVDQTGGNRITRVSYTVEGTQYSEGTGLPFSKLFAGERFYMKYDPSDPTLLVVFFERPFFSPEQVYNETECMSIKKEGSIINFSYEVNNQVFERQALAREPLYLGDHLLPPAKYIVKYPADNPEFGYLIRK